LLAAIALEAGSRYSQREGPIEETTFTGGKRVTDFFAVRSWSTRITRLIPFGVLVIGGSVPGGVSPAGASAKHAPTVEVLTTLAYGKILVSAQGYALYTYARDSKNHPNCTGACLASWPVAKVAIGVTPSATGVTGLGVLVRSRGLRQVTFRGLPLYRFVGDTKPGQVSGQGVNNFSVAKVTRATSTTTTVKGTGYGY